MARLERKNFKVFGENAPLDEIGQFGSAKATTKKNTKDIEEIQELDAWSDGWGGAVISNKNYPPMEEMTGAMNVMSYQTAYTLQEGIPEWNKDTTYYKGSIVKNLEGEDVKLYQSISNDNLNKPLSNTDNWSKISFGTGLEVCDIGMALYVDESKGLRRYLNGQIVDINANTQAFLDRLRQITTLYPSLLCTEDEWQTAKTLSKFGQVGKFVFNYTDDGVTVVSVRIPRVVNIQGLFDLQNLGLTVAESLPNIKGEFTAGATYEAKGSFYEISRIIGLSSGNTASRIKAGFDASRSSSTYQDNAPVQQEAIQYPYFIQIATGSETENNIVNEIELNNPYVFGKSEYSKTPKDSLSWLASHGQWNPKGTYPAYYNWILENVNNSVEGFKLSTAEDITDYDWVINTSDETFRLPLLDGSEDLPSDRYDDLELKASGSTYTAPANGFIYIDKTATGVQYMTLANLGTDGNKIKVGMQTANTTNGQHVELYVPAKRGDIVRVNYDLGGTTTSFRFIYAQGNGSLYYYVGETVQNANLIDAGRIGESLTNKVDLSNTQWATNACMPDYSAGVSITSYTSSSNQFTAPCNGIINWGARRDNSNKAYVNNLGWNTYQTLTTNPALYSNCTIPISKGETFYATIYSDGDDLCNMFFPLKGAN